MGSGEVCRRRRRAEVLEGDRGGGGREDTNSLHLAQSLLPYQVTLVPGACYLPFVMSFP